MKLTTTTQVSVDGVMQGNGGATDEDRGSGFESENLGTEHIHLDNQDARQTARVTHLRFRIVK